MRKIAVSPKPMNFVASFHETLEAGWSRNAHYHEHYEMLLIVRGGLRVIIQGEEYLLKPGNVILYPKLLVHQEAVVKTDSSDSTELYGLGWDREIKKLPLCFNDRNGRMVTLCRWLFEDGNNTFLADMHNQNALLSVLLNEVYKLEESASISSSSFLQPIRQYINQNLEDKISLKELSGIANLSKYHLINKYKKLTGRTPMEDLKIMRLEKAKNLIITTDLPMNIIAGKSGFCNEYHFSHMFKEYYKVPPSYFRKHAAKC